MKIFDRGSGPAVIVVPGVQGRWEWMHPALTALSRRCRAISYTLCGDFGSGMRANPEIGFENYLRQLDAVVQRTGVERFALCGVSYGGWIALRYAATRPERVSALILVSAPSPGWSPSARQRAHISKPWRSAPAFVVAAPFRVWPEIRAALPSWTSRLRFVVTHGLRVLSAPMIPPLMAARVRQEQALDFCPDCSRVRAPTLIISGEDGLDSVVPVPVTQRYRSLIPGSRYEMMTHTGHLGMVTQPDRFADLVSGFIELTMDRRKEAGERI
jgi:pimeloyl-ACP methyl ester carboxylesterase